MQEVQWVGNVSSWQAFYPKARVKGSLFGARIRYIQEFAAPSALAALRADLPEDSRVHLDDKPLPFKWYPLTRMVDFDVGIIRHLMGGDPSRMRGFGSQIAQYDLNRVFRLVLRVAVSPALALRSISSIYQAYFDPGDLRFTDVGPREGQLRLHESAMPAYLCEHGYSGFVDELLRRTGAPHARCEHTTCAHRGDAGCVWKCTW